MRTLALLLFALSAAAAAVAVTNTGTLLACWALDGAVLLAALAAAVTTNRPRTPPSRRAMK